MPEQTYDTAILFFSRSAGEESLSKNFLHKKFSAQNKKVSGKMIDRSVTVAKGSKLPFYIWDETKQSGETFGERLANAVEEIFKKGHQKILVIGNDCLHLSHKHILLAKNALQYQDTLVAPTKKGGAYLIGLTKNSFNKESFSGIRWQTVFTCQDLFNLYSPSAVCGLPVLDDVNDFTDLKNQLTGLLQFDTFRCFIQSIIASLQKHHKNFENQYSALAPRNFFRLKAPPALN